MAVTSLGLYELLAPQFLVGFTFPEYVDRYLSILGVDELHTSSDATGVVYSGRCSFKGGAGAAPVREHRDPSGAVFEWEDVTLDFRLTLPRDGAAFIDSTLQTAGLVGATALNDLFVRLGPVEGTPVPTDYPGTRFRLELLLSALKFHLGSTWLPATIDAQHRVIPDPARTSNDVSIVLPKVVFVYEQGDDLTRPPTFELASWGSGGFDAPHDLLAGEAIRMEPPLAVHESGRVGLGLGQVVLDLSANSTPPEILAFFGTDEAFKGVYVRSARVFYTDKDKDWAVNVAVQDVLISFAGEVSLEASIDIIGQESRMSVSVHLFEGTKEVQYVKGTTTGTIRAGEGTLLNTGVVHVRITGGVPPFQVSVRLEGTQIWDAATRMAPISPGAPGTLRPPGRAHLVVHVQDAGTTGSSGTQKTYDEEIDLNITAAASAGAALDGAPADRPPDRTDRPPAEFEITSRTPSPLPAGYDLVFTPAASGTAETLVVTGGRNPTVTVAGAPRSADARGAFTVEVPPGSGDIAIQVTWPSSTEQRETFRLLFQLGRPDPDIADASFAPIRDAYVADTEDPPDGPFSNSRAPSGPSGPPFGPAALRAWVQNRVVAGGFIAIDAHASFESAIQAVRDQELSERRLEVAGAIVRAARPGVVLDHETAHGHTAAASATPQRRNDPSDRVALIEAATSVASTGASIQARIRRPPIPVTPPAQPPAQPPAATPEPNRKPPVFRRAGLRIRLERNTLVLAEISGRLDLETDIEERLRTQTGNSSGDLGLTPTDAAVNENPEDGVVDFVLGITYDTATHTLAERLALGASPDDLNGLLQMTNPSGASTFKNVFGSVLVMAPVINSVAAALNPASAGDWVKVAISLGVPATIGALGVFRTEKVTLYGGELALRQHVPPGEALTFSSAGVIFDYGVEFGIHIEQLDINSTKPLKVRYKAVGFDLHFENGVSYQPIFDTSKGYELDISDPSLLNLPAPLGNILKILSARIARLNPLTLEVDLGLKIDLGVVTVDRFKIKWPLDPLGPPSILPTGVKVDISSVLVGSGYVNIVEASPNPEGLSGGGFDGTADVSLVPLKLRISASLGVRDLAQGSRKAIAIFAGLIVDFPAPIPLGQSGFGIFGFSGLFAMHYKRDELPPDGTAVSPALRWLIRAEGEPAKLIVNGDTLWVPEFDRWSFGVGVLLGSTEGGFVVNLRGMFVLELPGPRILIFVKIQIVAALPDLGEGGLDVGILGVVDLDFNLMQLTVGVIVDLGIGEIVKLTIPSEIFVKLNNPRIWHIYLGTHRGPASALILNLVRANGYFMAEGDRIVDWPGTDPPSTLSGLALATGLEASIVLGDEDIGLYLRVAAGAHLGISFSPKLFVVGRIYLEGELRIFIVSIEARGELQAQVLVESPSDIRTFIDGRICGKVSFFFFSVEGCVRHSIGTPVLAPAPPPLITSVFLQSHAPVLTSGQGGDRPIDASLGDAAVAGATVVPVVPIDVVPVIQMTASPLVGGATTFTTSLVAAPQQTSDGYIDLGGERQAVYELRELSLSPALPSGAGTPPATWRTERPPNPTSSDTHIDLALMSRVPTVASRAFERSTDLDGLITLRWDNLCTPIAPATCVLYTFCGQPLGPSGNGWRLSGTAQPDPPGTIRSTPPPTVLDVEEPEQAPADALIELLLLDAGLGTRFVAEIIGPNVKGDGGQPPDRDDLVCLRFPRVVKRMLNPLVREGARFDVRDATGGPVRANRTIRLGNSIGLDVGVRTIITLDQPSRVVQLTLVHFSSPARVVAFDAHGAQVDNAEMTVKRDQPETLTLRGKKIVRLRIDARQDETLLIAICFEARADVRLPIDLRRAFQPTGDERRDRRALDWLARAGERERRRVSEEADIATVRVLGSEPGLAVIAAAGTATDRATATAREGAATQCFRALKLPILSATPRRDPLKVPSKIEERGKKRPEDRWIILRTGQATQVVLFLAVAKLFVKPATLLIRQLDVAGNVVHEDPLTNLSPTSVTGVSTGLPPLWMAPAGPWRAHVLPVATFLADPLFAKLERMVVTIKPIEKCDRIQLLIPPDAPPEPPPGVLVGVVEVCPKADAVRQATDEAVQQGQIETVIGYLDGGSTVPLLAPNTTYTLRARYDISTRLVGGSPASAGSQTQEFRFKTDVNPPARLDPYVLGTTPDAEERYHFYEDPLKLVFNDLAVIQLYGAYGKKLRFALRAADGLAEPTHNISSLDPVPAEYLTPYRDFLEDMVAAGALPCVGSFDLERHGSWTSPVPLRPLMDYTLDVELDPAPPAPPATEPRVPFFRRSFTTSRFPTLNALVVDVKRKAIAVRALTSQISGLSGTGPVDIATDEAIQAALVAAGEQALPAANQTSVVIYWARRLGQTNFSPHAILIDAPEPLWRTRYEPTLETVPNQLDPAYKRIVPARADALVLVESGSSAVARFVHSPGGTRTLAILKNTFNPPAAGATVTIVARRPASTLYGLSVLDHVLLTLPLTPTAPWETDDA